MIKVTKEEAMAIRQMAPDSHVTIVNRQSNHKKYFAEENRETNAILREMRKQNVIYQAGDFGPKSKQKTKHEGNRHRHSAGHNGPRNDTPKKQWSKPQNPLDRPSSYSSQKSQLQQDVRP